MLRQGGSARLMRLSRRSWCPALSSRRALASAAERSSSCTMRRLDARVALRWPRNRARCRQTGAFHRCRWAADQVLRCRGRWPRGWRARHSGIAGRDTSQTAGCHGGNCSSPSHWRSRASSQPALHQQLQRASVILSDPVSRAYFYATDGEPWPVGYALEKTLTTRPR